jgi:hypothetical protein
MTLYISAAYRDPRVAYFTPFFAKGTYDASSQKLSMIYNLGANVCFLNASALEGHCCSWYGSGRLDSYCLDNIDAPTVTTMHASLVSSAVMYALSYSVIFLCAMSYWRGWLLMSTGWKRIVPFCLIFAGVLGIVSATAVTRVYSSVLDSSFSSINHVSHSPDGGAGSSMSHEQVAPAEDTQTAFVLLNVVAAFFLSIMFEVAKLTRAVYLRRPYAPEQTASPSPSHYEKSPLMQT